jgi:hypothetical protein
MLSTHTCFCTALVCLYSCIFMSVTTNRSTDQDQLFSSVPTFPFMHLITVLVTTLMMFEMIAEFQFGTFPKHFALSHYVTVRHIQEVLKYSIPSILILSNTSLITATKCTTFIHYVCRRNIVNICNE